MGLVSAAVCPHPMMMIPDIGGAGDDWAQLRTACLEAVRQLHIPTLVFDNPGGPPQCQPPIASDAPHLVVIVGIGDATRTFSRSGAYGSLLSNGVFWRYGWGQDADDADPLPLSLTLGYWLLSESSTGMIVCDVAYQAVDFGASRQDCLSLGRELAGRAERVSMIVMGEGSSCMTATARARDADRAKRNDDEIVRVLECGDSAALARIDARQFGGTATGRAAWWVLAGAADRRSFEGRLHADCSPAGQRYFAASWRLPT